MAINLRDYEPALMQGGNITATLTDVTIDDITVGGTIAVTGASTLTGAVSIPGAVTYSSTTPPIGRKVAVTVSGGTTRTITAANSGSVNLFDSAAGITYTLPAPSVGLVYDFVTTVLQTSSAHVVVTDAGTTFLRGYTLTVSDVDITPSNLVGPKAYAGDGSTHIKITTNGTTTGGGIGSWLRFICVSATVWQVSGIIRSPSGTIATPFST